MSDRHLVYLTDVKLITCVLQNGLAGVLEAAKNSGAQGRDGQLRPQHRIRDRMGLIGGMLIDEQKVVRIIVSEEQAARVFEAIYLAGKLDTPGKGIMYMSDLDPCRHLHPRECAPSHAQRRPDEANHAD